MIDRRLPGLDVDTIITDNQLGGYFATRHLLDLGHRRIACITGPSSSITPSADRMPGYRQALEDMGIPFHEELVCLGDFHARTGMEITEQLLKLPSPPTAIFACNDLMALGALRAVNKAGLRVPEDLSIVGFDNIDLTNYTNPPRHNHFARAISSGRHGDQNPGGSHHRQELALPEKRRADPPDRTRKQAPVREID